MLHTAARCSELFRLTWADVDLDGRTVRLGSRKRKGGELHFAKVPMRDALYAELKALKGTARSVYVFCQEDGQPFTSRQALMRRVCKRAGVRYFSFH
jgi:integrase